MYRGTPYLNKHLKRMEEQRSMQFHLANLTQMRPRTGTLEYTNDVHINKKKGQMQKQARFTQIERQNRILLQKISSIMGKQVTKSTKRTESQQKVNRSLNSQLRKRQLQNIEIENAKLLKRLQQKRPNYQTEKFHQSWKKQKYVIKNLSNYPFIISDKKRKRSSISQIGGREPKSNTIQLCRMREIDGVNFLITIRLNQQRLQIIGDTKDKKQIKVIQIQRKEAVEFIQQECSGKIQRIFDCLRYDKVDEVMYLVASEADIDETKNSTKPIHNKKDNPEFDIDGQQQQIEQENEQILGEIPIRVTNGSESKKYWVEVDKNKNQKSQKDLEKNNSRRKVIEKQLDQQQLKEKIDHQRKNVKQTEGKRKQSQKIQSGINTYDKIEELEEVPLKSQKQKTQNYQNINQNKEQVESNKNIQQKQQSIVKQSIEVSPKANIDIKNQQEQQVQQENLGEQKNQEQQENQEQQVDKYQEQNLQDAQNQPIQKAEQEEKEEEQKLENNQQEYEQEQFPQNQQIGEQGQNKNGEQYQNFQQEIPEQEERKNGKNNKQSKE